MRAKLFLIILCCAAWTACQGTAGRGDAHDHVHGPETAAHDHGDHDHEGHDHESEGHAHEGHDHDGHSHEVENHDHEADEHARGAEAGADAGEISLPAAKAAAAGVEVETVTAGPFRDVIVAGGRIMPAPGDETAVVVRVSGVV